MVPDQNHSELRESHKFSIKQRSKFVCDIRAVPWTDGADNQEAYVATLEPLIMFHGSLRDTNSNKIQKNL